MTDAGWHLLAVGAAALAVFLVAWLILDVAFGKTPMQHRLELLERFHVAESVSKRSPLDLVRRAATGLGDRLIRLRQLIRPAQLSGTTQPSGTTQLSGTTQPAGTAPVSQAGGRSLLDAAAVPVRASEWLVIQIGAALGGALLLLLSLPWWLALPVGALAGFAVPDAVLRVRVDRRKRAFAEELPDVLQMIVSSLRAGFTLQHGIEAGVRDSRGPVAAELRRALSETRLGAELEDALAGVGLRTGNHDMKWLVMAIRLQREVGGSLAEVLQTTAGTMREREELRRHVRALSAEGRLSAIILLAMPILLAAWMFLARRAYVRPLYTERAGLAMLLVAATLMLVGVLWLRRAIRVEV